MAKKLKLQESWAVITIGVVSPRVVRYVFWGDQWCRLRTGEQLGEARGVGTYPGVLAQNSELPRSLRFWRHCRTVARTITILSTVISILAFRFRRRTLGVGVTKACDHRRGAPFIRSSSRRAESRSYNPRFLFNTYSARYYARRVLPVVAEKLSWRWAPPVGIEIGLMLVCARTRHATARG